ncbi:hypothetical protein [Arthrobacter bambusae]|uniref:Uncharacterized protein n=1 Tax=Arthrobacter bambusae TaxID=1338426 RepID=A0AAW8D8R7_9MICC|nr:hypothetical protein [Arthrobacter bambusae]MDP9904672.1 hypothetical protein [Arthrobacter bambusae]MDQ0129488.1 hypothetical protein [Arthrobacter bambusae]MDQ0180899.1 hypothetical protein [Arthrobacter bambusae]
MSEKSPDRPTVSVGWDEIAELSRAWAEYTATAGNGSAPVDPILSLRKTGAVLRSVEKVLVSIESEARRKEASRASANGTCRET